MLGLNTSKTQRMAVVALFMSSSGCSSGKISFQQDIENGFQQRKQELSRLSTRDGIHLSQALQKNLSEPPPQEKKKLFDFISKVFSDRKQHDSFAECEKKFKGADECKFLNPSWSDSWLEDMEDSEDSDTQKALLTVTAPRSKSSQKKHSVVISTLVQQLKQGKTEPVPQQWEGDYLRALKSFREWSTELDTLSKKIVEQSECVDPELYNYLGLKAEEFFPNDYLLKRTIDIYTKADECAQTVGTGGSSRYFQNARFRLGLLSILRRDCDRAQTVFHRLSKMGPTDYLTRALYWGAYCALSDEKKEEFFTKFDELFKTNPLGYHTLSISNGDSLLAENILKPVDPLIKTRLVGSYAISGASSGDGSFYGQVNSWISILEILDHRKNYSAIQKLLAPIRKNPEYLMRLEPEVRLYLSTFAFRSGDTMSIFRILDSVFRTQSEYVVDSTLKLFYPMKYLTFIQSQVKRVNPFLISALIRQESAYQESAKSRVGAVGLMQLMPRTAKLMERSVTRRSLYDPEINIKIGIRYFEILVDRFHGDVELALASYNAGAETVDRWVKRYPTRNRLLFLDLIPYAETRNYVTLIGRNYYWYSKLYGQAESTAQSIFRLMNIQ